MTTETKDTITNTQFLDRGDGVSIAYNYTPGRAPCVVFLSGFKSDMTGSKATALEHHCQTMGQAFLRLDYQGHGVSSGTFEGGSIGEWAEDAVSVLDHMTSTQGVEKFLLVGSSMGGWIMLLCALQLKKRVCALIGIAAAPDFTENLIDATLNQEQRTELDRTGQIEFACDYEDGPLIITEKLLEDGRHQMLLKTEIDLEMPVRLIHGMEDEEVPWATALDLARQLRSTDVELQLVKSGGHRLSEPQDMERLFKTLDGLLKN